MGVDGAGSASGMLEAMEKSVAKRSIGSVSREELLRDVQELRETRSLSSHESFSLSFYS
jgi:hypothetical protein